MTTITEAINEIVDSLKSAGIAATSEATMLELPGVLVVPSTIEFPYLDDQEFNMEFSLFLMTSDVSGSAEVWIKLQELLQKVRTVYKIADALPINRPNSNISNPAPALLVTLQTTIS
ncbi:hypothetical protein [Arthrobacter sp. CJ23]|uniref:hypothetical protein n=1 Tax=Arthrobacter sp. CJ23 TaxID=2972479 RepID=UPI00215BC011|nr:hypothetical protein [Arthrobacter sp. CJ23]UVJ37982.1 hypothetical protein NVV90_11965 [Arthrobacter sp. CJ23]